MIKLAENIPFETAAAVTEGAHYAVGFLAHAKLKGHERVLVYGVTGAIGSAMIQILQARGIACTGVYDSRYVSNAARAAAALSALGVKHLIDAAHENFLATPNRYDFIFDAVGKSRFSTCKPLLKHGGCYLSSELGPRSENIRLSLAAPFMKKAKVRFPVPKKIEESLAVIGDLLANGKLKPLIDRSYPLDDAAQAFTYVLSDRKLGAVLLLP
jgi:NADPH:quinone reductase-like Zn-dependent oxidoreductase